MVVRRTPKGNIYHEPPYTPEEEAEIYGRVDAGPKTVLRQKGERSTEQPPPKPPAKRPS
jgi:hypothetical protein